MKKSVLWLIIILILATFFRLWDLKNVPPGLWADEAVNGVNTLQTLSGGWKVFYSENFGREGLFINIQSLFVWVFGTEPWVLRLPSAIIGILTVLGLYLMTKELASQRIGLFSSFFLATSFWHIMFSRIGFRAIMAPMLLVWSFYLLLLGMRKVNIMLIAVAGLLFGLGFHTYIAFRIAPLIAIYPLWVFYKKYRDGQLKKNACAPCLIILFIIMAILAASPLLVYYAKNPADFFGRTAGISILQSSNSLAQFSENFVKTIGMFNFFGDFNWRHNVAGMAQLWWPVGILFLIGLWLSIKSAINPKSEARNSKPYQNHNFILLWFVIMLIPVAISNEGLPHALRAIVLIPPAMIFAALGLEFIIENWKPARPAGRLKIGNCRPALAITLLFIFFVAATAHAYNTYFNRWAPNFNVYRAFQTDLTEKARWLKKQPNEVKKYVVTSEADSIDLRGRPMSLQPIIFITDTFFESKQKEKNLYYVTASEIGVGTCVEEQPTAPTCVIVPIESNPALFRSLKQKIQGLRLDISPGFVVLRTE